MRKIFVLVAALAGVASATLTTGIPAFGDHDEEHVAPVTDLSSSTIGSPDAVSPLGGYIYYDVTFTNDNNETTIEGDGTPVPAKLRSVTTGGGTFDAGRSEIPGTCSKPATGEVDPEIVCDTALFTGTISLEVAIKTPTAFPTVIESTSSALIVPDLVNPVFDENPDNNVSTVSTPVSNDPNSSSAVVFEGESLLFKTHTVTVVEGENGIVISLADASGEGDMCGSTKCGDGLHIGYGDDPDRQGKVLVTLRFATDPCRGLGAAKCTAVYERKFDENGNKLAPRALEACVGSAYDPTCIESVTKEGPNFVHKVRMVSTDPDLLSPGKF